MDHAGMYYTNLIGSGSWKLESSKHVQIIALPTQLSELKTEIQSLNKHASIKSSKWTTVDKPHMSTKNYGNFEAWCLVNKQQCWIQYGWRNFIGVMIISILDPMSMGCMYFTNQLNTMHGKLEKMNTIKDVERNLVLTTLGALLQRLHLLLPLLLHLQMHPRYPLQSHFKKLSRLLLDSAKISSIRFGKTVVMPWETEWPQM